MIPTKEEIILRNALEYACRDLTRTSGDYAAFPALLQKYRKKAEERYNTCPYCRKPNGGNGSACQKCANGIGDMYAERDRNRPGAFRWPEAGNAE